MFITVDRLISEGALHARKLGLHAFLRSLGQEQTMNYNTR